LVWAAIFGYVTWPAFRRVCKMCGDRRTLAAALMTFLVALCLILPIFWFALLLQKQVADAYQTVLSYQAAGGGAPPAFLREIPWVGELIQRAIDRYAADPLLVRQLLIDWAQQSRAELVGVIGAVGRNLAKLLLTIVTVFFVYRHGDDLVQQVSRIGGRFFGGRLTRYLRAAGRMTRAVVYGLLATALVQGLIAGIGYAIVGVQAPVLLGALTALASIVPVFGTFLVWGPVGLWLALNGHLWQGLGLLAWGTALVNPVDNLLRPLLISTATEIPFLLIMFGVIGGLSAFGLVGVFIGPAALAVATAVWREWLEELADDAAP
jgi:predicted PurR-regulated permease PerM